MANVKNVAPGIGLCAAIAIPCWFLGEALPVVGGPVFAILIGMVIALWWKQPARGTVQDGIAFTAKKVLQYAVILLGFGLNLAQIAAVGAESLPIIITTIAVAAGADAAAFAPLKTLSKFFIIMAMAAIGLNTDLVKLVKSGGKPILMGLICWICIAAASLGMQHLLNLW